MLNRRSELDLLRIYAMFLIVIWHVCIHGKLGESASTANRILLDILSGVTVIGTNLYVLLTGFFQCTAAFKWNKLLKLWGITFFYSVIIFAVFMSTTVNI